MHKLEILQGCTYFHRGYERVDYAKGSVVETDDDEFAAVAVAEKWAKKAKGSAPENKDAAEQVAENKAAA